MSFSVNFGHGNETEPPRPRIQLSVGVIFVVAAILLVGTVFFDAPIELSMFVALIALMLLLAVRGFNFTDIQNAIWDSMRNVLEMVMILLTVGMLVSTWAQAGTIPLIIRFGLETINPTWFYTTAIILCSITSLVTGTSWGTMGSVGVALMAVGGGLGLPPAVTAGAIISGAYFGDKLSMLSDSTNLAAAITGTPLLTHIRYMLLTTIPAYIGTLVIFQTIGFIYAPGHADTGSLDEVIAGLNDNFEMGWFSLLPAAVTVAMLIFRLPPYVAIFGGVVGAFFVSISTQGLDRTAVIDAIYNGFVLDTGIENIDDLISGGGMMSMAGLAMLFLFAVGVAGLLDKGGFISVLIEKFLSYANSRRKLMSMSSPLLIIAVGLGASFSFAAVMAGSLLKPAYKRMGLRSQNLSRTIEDSGTVYDAFYPWSAGGIFAAGALGVATFSYMPFMFFAFLSTIFGIIVALTQFKVATIPEEERDDPPVTTPEPDTTSEKGHVET